MKYRGLNTYRVTIWQDTLEHNQRVIKEYKRTTNYKYTPDRKQLKSPSEKQGTQTRLITKP